MGGFGTSNPSAAARQTGTPSQAGVKASGYGLSTEFAADNATVIPTPDAGLYAAMRTRRQIAARSGRDSTRLVGRQVYGNTFLGDTA